MVNGHGVPIFEEIIERLLFDKPMINHKISSSSNNLKHAYSSYYLLSQQNVNEVCLANHIVHRFLLIF